MSAHFRNRTARALVCLVIPLLFAGCAATPSRVLPDPGRLARTTGADEQALAEGRSYYLRECAGCHRHFWPRERTPAAWKQTLKEHRGRVVLTKRQLKKVELYLTLASSQAAEEGEKPADKR